MNPEPRPATMRLVAKALDDFGDDWHWVILHDVEPRGERRFFAARVDTICGIVLDEGGAVVTLHDTGAPDQPNCPQCLGEGMSPGLRADIERILANAESTPIEV